MRLRFLLGFIFLLALSCRTSRQQVEVMDKNAEVTPNEEGYLSVDATMESSLTITALSLPTQKQDFDHLEISLLKTGSNSLEFTPVDYKVGQAIKIKPYFTYELILTAFRLEKELYSTQYCTTPQRFHAELGRNVFTASLCTNGVSP